MRYAHILCRILDALIHVVKLFRGELSALISLFLCLFDLYEIVRHWLDARAKRAEERPLDLVAYKAA